MTLNNQEILIEYSKLLVEESKERPFHSEALLPCSVGGVQKAISETLMGLDAEGVKKAAKQLIVTYIYLAHFLTPDDFGKLSQYWKNSDHADEAAKEKHFKELQTNTEYMALFHSISSQVEKKRKLYKEQIELMIERRIQQHQQSSQSAQ